jgi:hypothetical protein
LKEYLMRDYRSPLRIPEGKVGKFEVRHQKAKPGEKFRTANLRCAFFGQKSDEVSWPHETTWTSLLEEGRRWMSDMPCEQAQHDKSLRGMSGRVLVGGLGLGYAATVLARKKAVREIVVVEMAQEVIDLVWRHLKLRGKASVVKADLFDYLRNLGGLVSFDNAFYDIWAGDNECTFFKTVCPLRELSGKCIRNEPACWNEDIMRGQLYQSLQSKLMMHQHRESLNACAMGNPWVESGSIWNDWSVPFFQWWNEIQPNDKLLTAGMACYASIYGRYGWAGIWKAFKLFH